MTGVGPEANIAYTEPYAINLNEIDEQCWKPMKPIPGILIKENVKNLMKIGKDKDKYLRLVTKKRYLELNVLMEKYSPIGQLHSEISIYQKKLRSVLNDIICGKKLSKNKGFKTFLESYNFFCRTDTLISHTDEFFYDAEFLHEEYYDRLNEDPGFEFHSLMFGPAISYALIEFLKAENKDKIKKCPYCNKFFIANDRATVKEDGLQAILTFSAPLNS